MVTYAQQAESVLIELEARACLNSRYTRPIIEASREARDRLDRVSVVRQRDGVYDYCRETQCLGEWSNRDAALYWIEQMLQRDDRHHA